MNSTGRGLCSVKSSTEEETQPLQALWGGLDRDSKRAISLDDVNVEVTEIVRLPREVTNVIQRAKETAEEHLKMENVQAMAMDELAAQLTNRPISTPSLLTPVLSGMSWVRVQRGRRRDRRVDGNPMHTDNGRWLCDGYYAVLGDTASDSESCETDEDINMKECQSSGVSGNNDRAQRGNQDGKHDCEAPTLGVNKCAGCMFSGKV